MFAALLVLLAAVSCADQPDPGQFAAPSLGDVSVKATAHKATCQCTIVGSPTAVTERTFHIEGGGESRIVSANGSGVFSANLSDLKPDTQYTIYASISNGINEVRSEAKEFTTASAKDFIEVEDKAFENYLIKNFDRNLDGEISVIEAKQITNINVCTDTIQSLKGIEQMPFITKIDALGTRGQGTKGLLEDIDVSSLAYLSSLRCYNNLLTEIDVSHNPYLQELDCSENLISELDISNNIKLEQLSFTSTQISTLGNTVLPDLDYLNAQGTKITVLNFSQYPKLRDFNINGCPISVFPDPDHPENIECMHICNYGGAYYLPDGAYFSKFPKLRAVNYGGYKGETIDLSKNTGMEQVWGMDCPHLRTLDLSNSPYIKELYVYHCPDMTIYLHPDAHPTVIEADDSVQIVRK